MSFVQAILEWTDSIAASDTRSRGLMLIPIAPWFLVAAYQNTVTIVIAAILSIAALIFVSWRLFVVTKDQAAQIDREYDKTGKFKLASEYHSTESATAAAERKGNG